MKTMMACICAAAVMYLAGSCSDNVPVVNPKPVMPSADIVLGMVHSGDIMLEDVIVTDGYNFTRTDRNGQFYLASFGQCRICVCGISFRICV